MVKPISIGKIRHQTAQYEFLWAVCVKPVENWKNVEKMRLFLDYYIKQGAGKFVLYHRSWSLDVDKLLNNYSSRYLEIYPWPVLPILNNTAKGHVKENVQNLAINHCIWSMKNRFASLHLNF